MYIDIIYIFKNLLNFCVSVYDLLLSNINLIKGLGKTSKIILEKNNICK
jgi:hypothetical protein